MKRPANEDISASSSKLRKKYGAESEPSFKRGSAKADGDLDAEQGNPTYKPRDSAKNTGADDAIEYKTPTINGFTNLTSSAAYLETAGDGNDKKEQESTQLKERGGRGKDDEHEQPKDEKEDASLKKSKEDRIASVHLLLQLSIVLEKRRVMRKVSNLLAESPEGMTRLCDLAADPNLALNPFLRVLPFEFYWEMEDVKKAVAAANTAQEEIKKREEEVVARSTAHKDALVQRAFVLLRFKEHSEAIMKAHDEAVGAAWDRLSQAREARIDARKKWERCLRIVDDECKIPLDNAEDRLVQAGHLHALPTASEDHSQGDNDHTPASSNEATEQPDAQKHQRGGIERESDLELPPRGILDDIKQSKQRFMERSRLRLIDAEDNFDAVRANYYRNLDDFLQARRHG